MNRFLLIILFTVIIAFGNLYSQVSENKMEEKMAPEAAELYNEGNDLMKSGNYTGAISNYEKALSKDKDYRIYYQRGLALKKVNKFADAQESLQSCLKLNPNFGLAYNALGAIEFSQKDYKNAIEHFEKFRSMTDNVVYKSAAEEALSFSYAKLGQTELDNGNTKEAVILLKKAVGYNDNDAAYLMLSKFYVESEQYEEAINAANSALKYKKTISAGGPHYYMGLAYKNLGNKEKAKEEFEASAMDATYKKLANYELTSLE